MNDVKLSELVVAFSQVIEKLGHVYLRIIKCRDFLEDLPEEATYEDERTIREEEKKLVKTMENHVKGVYDIFHQNEEDYGGGWTDIGPSKAFRLMAEGDYSRYNLTTFIEGLPKLLQKMILLDSNRIAQESLEEMQQTISKSSKNSKDAA